MTFRHKVRAVFTALFTVALMLVTVKVLFHRAKEQADEAQQLAAKAVKLEQKVFTLAEHADALNQRHATLLSVINFHIDNPHTVLFIASPDGTITEVDGDVGKWGFTRDIILGMKIEELRPLEKRGSYRMIYQQRSEEGKTGEVHFFENDTMIGGDGKQYLVSGGVFWHDERKEFVAFIAPASPPPNP
jgi:cbb3-type cytochrome oxidase subunit 3